MLVCDVRYMCSWLVTNLEARKKIYVKILLTERKESIACLLLTYSFHTSRYLRDQHIDRRISTKNFEQF